MQLGFRLEAVGLNRIFGHRESEAVKLRTTSPKNLTRKARGPTPYTHYV